MRVAMGPDAALPLYPWAGLCGGDIGRKVSEDVLIGGSGACRGCSSVQPLRFHSLQGLVLVLARQGCQ